MTFISTIMEPQGNIWQSTFKSKCVRQVWWTTCSNSRSPLRGWWQFIPKRTATAALNYEKRFLFSEIIGFDSTMIIRIMRNVSTPVLRLPRVKPLDTDVLRGSFRIGLWDSKKLSSSRCRVFSTGKEALRLSDMPYWYIILQTKANRRQMIGKQLRNGLKGRQDCGQTLLSEPTALKLHPQG